MDTVTTPHQPPGSCPCESFYGIKAARQGQSIAQTMAAQINARDREIARLREGFAALRARMDGGWETDAGGFNVTVYDFNGMEMIDALLTAPKTE